MVHFKKIVTMLSSFARKDPVQELICYNRKTKIHEKISCPNVTRIYNKHISRVDVTNSLIGRGQVAVKPRNKWYLQLSYHLLDMTDSC